MQQSWADTILNHSITHSLSEVGLNMSDKTGNSLEIGDASGGVKYSLQGKGKKNAR